MELRRRLKPVAGTEIRPRVAIEGADYAYVDHRTSEPGQRARSGGCLLSAGWPHTITVTMDAGLPDDVVAGIVLYERAG